MSRPLVGAAAVWLVVIAFAIPAGAKMSGPFDVLTPDSKLRVVEGKDADAFWKEWWRLYSEREANCFSCDSPSEAAEMLQSVHTAYYRSSGSRPTGYLLRPHELGDATWEDAYVFYPATDQTPAYLVDTGGVGKKMQRWDWWSEASPKMQEIVLAARSVNEKDESPWRWVVIAVAAAALGAAMSWSVLSRR